MILTATVLAAACLGLLVGYTTGCERVHRIRRQRNIAWRNLDNAHAELARHRCADLARTVAQDKALNRLLTRTPERSVSPDNPYTFGGAL